MFAFAIASLDVPNFDLLVRTRLAAPMMFRRFGGHTARCCGRWSIARRTAPGRKFSAYTSASAATPSPASPLGGITVELDRIAPRFEVPAAQITILDSPAAFYNALKVGDRAAQVSIVLS